MADAAYTATDLASALHGDAGAALRTDGFCVIDGAIERPDRLLAAMELLRECGALRPHRFGFRQTPTSPVKIAHKPHIFEAELGDAPVQAAAPQLAGQIAELRLAEVAAAAFPALQLRSVAPPDL